MSRFVLALLFVCYSCASFSSSAFGQEPPLAERTARQTPESVVRGVIYQINPRAFTPEGTLNAATKKLPKLAELGVTIVYLCPVFVSDDDPRREFWSPRQKKSGFNNPRNPYRMKDYYAVDPEYGTDADLKAFVDEARRLGLSVWLDMVYLHCGPSAKPIEIDPNFVRRDANGKIVNADWAFPALNFENPKLREYLWKNMEYWVRDFGVDGFRLDVSDGVPLDFWEEARRRLDAIRPEIVLFGEGVRFEDQLNAMDLNYAFPFFSALDSVLSQGAPASKIRETKEKMAANRPRGARFAHYFDNHDIANDDYENRREKRWGDAGVRAAFILCMTLDGTPMIYNGQEIADANRHSIFGRLSIDWSNAETDAGKERFAFLQRLVAARLNHSSLTNGTLKWLDVDRADAVLAFLRDDGNERILTAINLKNESVSATVEGVDAARFEPIFDSVGTATVGEKATLELPPFGYCSGLLLDGEK